MDQRRTIGYKALMAISCLVLIFLLAGQTFSLINYDITESLGLQESEEEVTLLGIAWLKAFALGDTMSYIPLLIAGLIGLHKRKSWGFYAMFGSLAISVYWPIVNLSAVYLGKDELTLSPDKYISYSVVLPLIVLYGLWGIWYLYRHQNLVDHEKP